MEEKYFLSFDIGGTYVKYASIDSAGKIINKNKYETPMNLEMLRKTMYDIIDENLKHLKGIVISAPGSIDPDTGIIYHGGALPFLDKFSFKKEIELKFDIPCAVCNDGKAAALSEMWLGNLKHIKNCATIVLGTGVGSGIIIDSKIVQGKNFQAGELSFMIHKTFIDGQTDIVGYAGSAVLFIKKCAEIIGLEDLKDGITVFKEINKRKNIVLNNYFEEYCKEIAFIIINLQAILDLEKVCIGGGISSQPILIKMIEQQYIKIREQSILMNNTLEKLEIEACLFENEANLLGAVYQLLLNFEKKI